MKVQLLNLDVTNYRNIKHAFYAFDGNSKIVGDNRIGKTNTLEAIIWLISGKLLGGSADIAAIKPLDDTKSEVRVEGTFSIFDETQPQVPPKTITLRKEYGEDWVKTRGTNDIVFKGHYLKYYYNGVLQKTEKDYLSLFRQDFGISGEYKGIEIVRMLIDPFYLGDMGETLNWTNLRAFIISLIGDVKDSDIFDANESLEVLKPEVERMGGRIEEVKKFYSNLIKGLKEQIIGDDSLIKHLEEIVVPDEKDVNVSKDIIKQLSEDIAKLQSDKSNSNAVVELDKQINELVSKKNNLYFESINNSKQRNYEKEIDALNQQYRNVLSSKATTREIINSSNSEIKVYEAKIEECSRLRLQYIERLRKIDDELATPVDTTCPYCGHELEGDQLKETVEKQQKSLIDEKATIMEKGKENKRQKEYYESFITGLKTKIQNAENDLAKIDAELETINVKIKDVSDKLSFEKTVAQPVNPEIQVLETKIDELKQEKERVISNNKAADTIISEKIAEKYASIEGHQKLVDEYNYAIRQKEECEKAKETKKEHSLTLADLEQKLELTNLFNKIKLEMLDEKVEKVFGNIKFQLIKENINGGFDPICKPYIFDSTLNQSTSTVWKSGSKSERVITGIAIAECIKKALGLFDLPYLFDEGGEISTDTFNTKFKTDSQLICVKVVDNINIPTVMKI